jgi:hypothetical protein
MYRTPRFAATLLVIALAIFQESGFGASAEQKPVQTPAPTVAPVKAPVPAPAATPAAAPAPEIAPQPLPNFGTAKFDSAITDQARIFAGMQPLDSVRYQRLTTTKGWKVHHELFEQNWAKLDKRIQGMSQWRASELGAISTTGATLFYPFSGPDFLNGDIFFPDCERSVYISLETTGEIPSADMNEKLFTNFIEDIRASLSTIFVRNYFITQYMMKQLHTPYLKGNLALFLVFLARRDCAVVSINKIHLDTAGVLVAAPCDSGKAGKKQIPGMEIQYIKALPDGNVVHHLYYFSVDIQDSSLKHKVPMQTYLRGLGDVVMFTKAASYCMHGDNFSMFRDICLRSRVVLEDDSGIPYRFFKPDAWTVSLYGNYTKPVKDFNFGFQKDLDAEFRSGKNVKPLPFNIGYHWKDSFSSLILAVRKNEPAPATR